MQPNLQPTEQGNNTVYKKKKLHKNLKNTSKQKLQKNSNNLEFELYISKI